MMSRAPPTQRLVVTLLGALGPPLERRVPAGLRAAVQVQRLPLAEPELAAILPAGQQDTAAAPQLLRSFV